MEVATEVGSNCEITEQLVNKMVRHGIHYLHITTKYNVDEGLAGYEAVASYNYSID